MKRSTFVFLVFAGSLIVSCKSMVGLETASVKNIPSGSPAMDTALVHQGAAEAAKLVTSIKILYGTDRKLIHLTDGTLQYGNVQANPTNTKYDVGYTIVSIPPGHKMGNIETPSIWKFQFSEDTMKHIVQRNITPLSDNDFNAMLKNAKNGQDAFIFVHGYNNSFKDASLRTAQLAEDIHLPVTPIMFSWSSNASVGAYINDGDRVQAAVPAFIDFLKRVAKNSNFKKIHLIAHSMGNRLISAAMLQLKDDATQLKIDQIIMAAPDVEVNSFQNIYAGALIKRSKHVTIYVAKNDWALFASKTINNDIRLGEIGVPPPVYSFGNLDVIDAVKEKTDFLGHDRFARSPKIIADMDSILKSDQTAAQRKIPSKVYGSYVYYYFE